MVTPARGTMQLKIRRVQQIVSADMQAFEQIQQGNEHQRGSERGSLPLGNIDVSDYGVTLPRGNQSTLTKRMSRSVSVRYRPFFPENEVLLKDAS
ncbi:hypothetical protein J6590_045989 [Homalodisca vitripennis]|nr:hypothetical protein J6590_045989 [Homalodisca vitripennis]